MNGEFARGPHGSVELVAGGYFDKHFWGRQVAYPANVDALVSAGYEGYVNWEFRHPASALRAAAEQKARATAAG